MKKSDDCEETENVGMDVLLTVCFIELIWESRF